MHLKKFTPMPWISEISRCILPSLGKKAPKPIIVEKMAFATFEEATNYSTAKTKSYTASSYTGTVRAANPKDYAEQRIAEIAEALAKALERTLEEEEYVLAYDTESYGNMDFETPITTAIEDIISCYPPEGEDPSRDGWVGTNGLP